MEIITARVNPNILNKADRLFNNSLTQILVELLQNARRAGATLVNVIATRLSPKETEVVFSDNGKGIDEFSQLLNLGASGWEEDIERDEDPAGMGLFSLIHSGVTIQSKGKTVTLTRESFLGRQGAEVVEVATTLPMIGTTLTFTRGESLEEVLHTLRHVVQYGPVDVIANGEMLPRQDFLTDAAYVKEINGVRIGVFETRPVHSDPVDYNFHGHVIQGPYKDRIGDLVVLGDNDQEMKLGVKVDIVSTATLHLKLPDRNCLVEDHAYKAIREQIMIALFEYLATVKRHVVPYSVYKMAHEAGVAIREAAAYLRPFYVRAGESEISEPFDSDWRSVEPRVLDPSICVLVDLEAGVESEAGFALDRILCNEHLQYGVMPVLPEPGFEGYSWYDKLIRLDGFSLAIDGKPAEEFKSPNLLTIVDSLTLSFVIDRGTGETEKVEHQIDFAGWKDKDETGVEALTMVITKDSSWVKSGNFWGESFSLVEAAYFIAFDYNDDIAADSWETQEERYKEEVEAEIIKMLNGPLSLAKAVLRKALNWDVESALDQAGLTEVRLVKTDGRWSAEFPVAT